MVKANFPSHCISNSHVFLITTPSPNSCPVFIYSTCHLVCIPTCMINVMIKKRNITFILSIGVFIFCLIHDPPPTLFHIHEWWKVDAHHRSAPCPISNCFFTVVCGALLGLFHAIWIPSSMNEILKLVEGKSPGFHLTSAAITLASCPHVSCWICTSLPAASTCFNCFWARPPFLGIYIFSLLARNGSYTAAAELWRPLTCLSILASITGQCLWNPQSRGLEAFKTQHTKQSCPSTVIGQCAFVWDNFTQDCLKWDRKRNKVSQTWAKMFCIVHIFLKGTSHPRPSLACGWDEWVGRSVVDGFLNRE